MYISNISTEELQELEYASFPGKICVVDSVGTEFKKAVNYIRSQKIIGFDTETRPCFSPDQPRCGVALLQLSGPEKAYLFRIKHIGMDRRLCNILSSDKIIKVGAAVNDDTTSMAMNMMIPASAALDFSDSVKPTSFKSSLSPKEREISCTCSVLISVRLPLVCL